MSAMEVDYDDLADWKAGIAPQKVMDEIVDDLIRNPTSTIPVKVGKETVSKLFKKDDKIWEATPIAGSEEVLPSKPIYTIP